MAVRLPQPPSPHLLPQAMARVPVLVLVLARLEQLLQSRLWRQ